MPSKTNAAISALNAVAFATDVAKDMASAAEAVPVVGAVAKVLLEVARACEEIKGTLKDADEVGEWALEEARLFQQLENRPSDSSKPIDGVLRVRVERVAKSIEQLLELAEKIKSGSRLKRAFRARAFRDCFKSAQDAVERAYKDLNNALMIDTNATGRRVEEGMKEVLKILREALPAGSQLTAVVDKIEGGDGAGAAAALADMPEEVRQSAPALLAKGAALAEQGDWAGAIAAYRKCLRLDPDMSGAWFALGYAY